MKTLKALLLGTALATAVMAAHAPVEAASKARTRVAQVTTSGPYQHVLVISIDGMHQLDLSNYLNTAFINSGKTPSMLLELSDMGTVFINAWTPMPSNNFPGTLAILTGGTPESTGVWYDDSYDRSLYPPGSACNTTNFPTPGTEVNYTQFIDVNPNTQSGGGTAGQPMTQIDPTKLPLMLNPSTSACTAIYPHSFLQTNTVFEAVHAGLSGSRTAWADDHPSYEILNGNSGTGVDDLYTPELNAFVSDFGTGTLSAAEQYDTLKVNALLNEINGMNSTGTTSVGVPVVFGMNFKSLEVAQRAPQDTSVTPSLKGGYKNSIATPNTMVTAALSWIDGQISTIVSRLSTNNLMNNTLIIITAKYGDAPINPASIVRVNPTNPATLTNYIDSKQHGLDVPSDTHATYFGAFDDVAPLWYNRAYTTNQNGNTEYNLQQLAYWLTQQHSLTLHLDYIMNWQALFEQYNTNPYTDNRTPDMILIPFPSVLYTTSKEIAAHGGVTDDDLNVALMVSAPNLPAATSTQAVTTTQIAPTIMTAIGLPTTSLNSVNVEGTPALPIDFP
jgi:hypothetical protein